MRRTMLAVTACALLLTVSIVSPAIGGPSVSKVAKQAKKALKLSKGATRKASGAARKANGATRNAKAAGNAAGAAQSTANTANSKADQALARPVVTTGGITKATNTVAVAGSSAEVAAAVCPAGQRVISGGVVSDVPVGGTWADVASEDRTGWIGGAENLDTEAGELTVEAYCAPAGRATIASRTAVRRKINREVAAYKSSR